MLFHCNEILVRTMVNGFVCNGNVQLSGWRCLSGWLPWKSSARILERETKGEFHDPHYRHDEL